MTLRICEFSFGNLKKDTLFISGGREFYGHFSKACCFTWKHGLDWSADAGCHILVLGREQGKSEPEGSSVSWSALDTYLSPLPANKLLTNIETQAQTYL